MRNYGAAAPLLSGAHVVEVMLFEFRFASGTSRYNSSMWDIEWNGHTWFRGNGLFSYTVPREDTTLAAHGAEVTLSAMNPALLSRALSEKVKGRPARIYHMVMHPETFAVVGVSTEFGGRMSTLNITSEWTLA